MSYTHIHMGASSPAMAILCQGWTQSLVKVGGAQTTSWPWLQACSRPLRWTQPLSLRPGGWGGGGFPALLWSLFPLPGMESDEVSNHRSLPIPSKHVILLVSEHLFRFFLVQAPLTQAPSLFFPSSSL